VAIALEEHTDEKGLSARHLVLLFLAGIAVCGVFFSLGFLVGFNERFARSTPATERVGSPAAVPPTVNPPDENVSVTPKDSAAGHAPISAAPDATTAPGATSGASDSKAEAPSVSAPAARTTAKSEDTQPASPDTPSAVGEGITLQVAAMRNRQDADAMVNVLKERGYSVFVVKPEYAHSNDNLYRVQVGPFPTREEADKQANKLRKEGFKPFVRH